MAEGAFVEGDQPPRDKDLDEGHERVPSRLVEEHGDDVLQQPAEPAMPLLSSDAALDEGIMVGELLKKSRLKNPTLTDRKALLLDDKNLSVFLEATQNITLRYHLLGTIQQESASETPPPVAAVKGLPATAAALPTSPRALSSSDEMLYFKEKVRSAPGPVLERRGASCSRLQHMGGIAARIGGGAVAEKAIPGTPVSRCATLPPAYSPSQLNMGRVKSQIATLTLKKSSLLRAGDGEQAARKLSKITQIVVGAVAKPRQPSNPLLREPNPRLPSPPAPQPEVEDAYEDCDQLVSDDTECIRDRPVLEVLDKCELEPVPAAELVRRRVRRYYGGELGVVVAEGRSCSGSSEDGGSLVKLDFTLPTEASELAAERIAASRAGASLSPHESSTSWYSFESDPSSRRSAVLQAASASCSEAGSWAASSRRGSTPAAEPAVAAECFKASSLIRYFESIRPRAPAGVPQ
ncbi:uncharacterized protein LOC125947600 [Dermacentor silvarum]|uniref:uncharacterized protein LOC125947600 n=1 Tax=Dermacentor silvarum TaxID=543639 RepID=UPI002100C05C|nr:uncharacterized protein LOC125947600 [Dermacentor silvarum]